ncbi:unnamed protein product [Clonostachys solani]|uniref:Uncharacterized protein n=1 Tax=Clonostachys solani TaxID=160281 RepID=A0A9P0EHK7_9HYPO|nr:unnamed protein product [Clonostachys solani]
MVASTSCLHSGSDCIYPSRELTPCVNEEVVKYEVDNGFDIGSLVSNRPLNSYVGGSFDVLPEASKVLLRHYAVFSVRGQRPVVRENELSVISKAFENPGYMHMCLVLAACQWAWVRGSLDEVTLPFLHHKSATYRFVREQLLSADTARTRETNLAISTLALTEAAIGDLETSTKHLMGFRTAMQSRPSGPSLPQKMLKTQVYLMAGKMSESLRQMASVPHVVPVSEYQPTFLALIFTSIWDITALPPTEAPKYGWWEAASVWQNHTKHLNLNYELSRGFNPDTYKPRILNGDPQSSRTCFIATFFYLVSEVGAGEMDTALVDWLLEQLIDDITTCEQRIGASPITGPLWLWYVLFGAAVADSSRASDVVEAMQLAKWKRVFEDKLSIVNEALGITDWATVRPILAGITRGLDHEGAEDLRGIWEGSTFRNSSSAAIDQPS